MTRPNYFVKGRVLKRDLDYVLVQELDLTTLVPTPSNLSVFERKLLTRLEFGLNGVRAELS